jgi:hypothetical protein
LLLIGLLHVIKFSAWLLIVPLIKRYKLNRIDKSTAFTSLVIAYGGLIRRMESPKALPSFTANPADTLNTSPSCGVLFFMTVARGGAGMVTGGCAADGLRLRLIHPTFWATRWFFYLSRRQGCRIIVVRSFLGRAGFFTVNLLQRRNNDLLIRHVDTLRSRYGVLIRIAV